MKYRQKKAQNHWDTDHQITRIKINGRIVYIADGVRSILLFKFFRWIYFSWRHLLYYNLLVTLFTFQLPIFLSLAIFGLELKEIMMWNSSCHAFIIKRPFLIIMKVFIELLQGIKGDILESCISFHPRCPHKRIISNRSSLFYTQRLMQKLQ